MNIMFKTFFMIIVVSILQGCNEKQTAQKNTQSNITTQAYVKPHAAIYLNYEKSNMQVGIEANVSVSISSGKKADDLTISYFVKDDAINLYNARTPVSFGTQQKNQLNTHVLTLMPNMDGEFMIYISATATKNGKSLSRSFIIPVIVGNLRKQKALKPVGKITIDSSGTPIISMPAVETTD